MHFKVEVPLFIALMVSWVSCQDCGSSKLTANYGEFMSPNYPNKYDHNADCTWTIIAPRDHFIEVQFEKFDVRNPFWECTHDYITVTYDDDSSEKFCNDHKAPDVIKSRTNTLTFHLLSDHFFSNGVGFKAKYYIVDKSGNKLAGEDDDNDGWDDESTSVIATTTTTSTTTPTTTTTTEKPVTTTTSTTTTTTTSTTKSPTSTTSTLISKLTSVAVERTTTSSSEGNDNGLPNDPGAMSGVLIGVIIGVVLIVFTIILFVAFVRYRRNKNKRIDLSVIEVADGKELISDDKVYKKQGKRIVRVPEAETFPL